MRFKCWVIAVSLAITLAVGGASLVYVRGVSNDMLGALARVRAAVDAGGWSDAAARADAMHRDWLARRDVLQLFLSHRDTDAVEMTLARLIAAVGGADAFGAAREIADADAALRNLPLREKPTLSNVL
jgi:hypothetical protein